MLQHRRTSVPLIPNGERPGKAVAQPGARWRLTCTPGGFGGRLACPFLAWQGWG